MAQDRIAGIIARNVSGHILVAAQGAGTITVSISPAATVPSAFETTREAACEIETMAKTIARTNRVATVPNASDSMTATVPIAETSTETIDRQTARADVTTHRSIDRVVEPIGVTATGLGPPSSTGIVSFPVLAKGDSGDDKRTKFSSQASGPRLGLGIARLDYYPVGRFLYKKRAPAIQQGQNHEEGAEHESLSEQAVRSDKLAVPELPLEAHSLNDFTQGYRTFPL